MAYTGYHFFIGDVELPYAPSELTVSTGSNNKTVELISGQEVNLLALPKLTEIEFKIDLPRGREYPFARKEQVIVNKKTGKKEWKQQNRPEIYTEYFEDIKLNKKPIWLIITRPNPNATGKKTETVTKRIKVRKNDFESTKIKVTLEDYSMKESADNAFDVTVSFKFKQYVKYGTVVKVTKKPKNNGGKNNNKPVKKTPKKVTKNKSYVVKSGDCLWKIAKKFYGDGTKWKKIYNANKKLIEKTAKKYGKKSSSNGWWIYPGTKLTIPMS